MQWEHKILGLKVSVLKGVSPVLGLGDRRNFADGNRVCHQSSFFGNGTITLRVNFFPLTSKAAVPPYFSASRRIFLIP